MISNYTVIQNQGGGPTPERGGGGPKYCAWAIRIKLSDGPKLEKNPRNGGAQRFHEIENMPVKGEGHQSQFSEFFTNRSRT